MTSILTSRRHFYPRSPCGERPIKGKPASPVVSISIHALLAESDNVERGVYLCIAYFYPRSPCGERPGGYGCAYLYLIISIHAILAESDFANFEGFYWWVISIHALLAESDLAGPSGPAFLYNFYPRSPCGERHAMQVVVIVMYTLFLSTLSLRRATQQPAGEKQRT